MRRLKYLLAFLVPVSVYISFTSQGWMTYIPIIVFFGFVPMLELLIKPDTANLDKRREEDERNQTLYDWILYLAIPIQLSFLIYFLFMIRNIPFASIEFFGYVTSMGLMCGVIGINVGHELGHRSDRVEQLLGEILLLTSLDTHFLPYHNGGHHRNVATPKDAATAAKNEWLFIFWFTSHFKSYAEAWRLESARLRKKGKPFFSLRNRMVVYSMANIAVILLIYFFFGYVTLVGFLLSAIMGIGLLETVNYIEHYGLTRKKDEYGIYESVKHHHSWNSDHPIGRTFLFNLSRHSDHHYNGSKKYQVLKSLPNGPQMPTGYPGMMLLATVQPLWFWVMNKKLKKLQTIHSEL